MPTLKLSPLTKTWIIDLDGTLVKHNGHLDEGDSLLPGVKPFFENLPAKDVVIILTARSSKFETETKQFLEKEGIRYNALLFDMPHGERVLINDEKPSGLQTAYAICLPRNAGLTELCTRIDEAL